MYIYNYLLHIQFIITYEINYNSPNISLFGTFKLFNQCFLYWISIISDYSISYMKLYYPNNNKTKFVYIILHVNYHILLI